MPSTIAPLPPPTRSPAARPGRFDPGAELLSGGNRASLDDAPRTLSRSVDDLTREFGPLVYDRMMLDAKVASAIRYLKISVLADGLTISPAIEAPDPDRAPPKDAPTQADIDLAEEVADFCRWSLERLERPLGWVLYELLEALTHGNKLAEIVYEPITAGRWAGKLAHKALKVKPRESWSFVCDRNLNVLGIRPATTPDELVPREKVAILAWDPRDGDPRGTSLLRPAYEAYNLKSQTWPEYFGYLQTFASPSVWAELPEGGLSEVPVSEVADYPDQTVSYLTGAQFVGFILERWSNRRWAVTPPGVKVNVIPAQGAGEAHTEAIDVANREIDLALLGATRMTQEAENGSKADSQTAQDVVGVLVRWIKTLPTRMVEWDVLWNLVRYNYGRDVADRMTPKCSLGQTEAQDFGAAATGWATLNDSGLIAPNQRAAVQRDWGKDLPEPEWPEPVALPLPGGNSDGSGPPARPQPAGPAPQPGAGPGAQ